MAMHHHFPCQVSEAVSVYRINDAGMPVKVAAKRAQRRNGGPFSLTEIPGPS